MSEQFSTMETTPTTTLVTELVGEGKKYKTADDLARGKLEADTFIEKLKTENAALREALDSEGSPDQVLERINKVLQSKGSGNAAATQVSNQSQQAAPISEEKVLELLNTREREKVAKQNVDLYNATVGKVFGDKVTEVVQARLTELGMDSKLFQAMVTQTPQAALQLLGIKEQKAASGGIGSTVNTEAYFGSDNLGEKQNFAYFQKLRRELKERYYEPEIQKKVFEARKKMGEDFWKA